jgi:hypothetical protein
VEKGTKVSDLTSTVIDAHGGLDRWNQLTTVDLHLAIGGVMWAMKGHDGVINEIDSRLGLHRQYVTQFPFTAPGLRTSYTPDRIAVETYAGEVVEERLNPRQSFAGHVVETPWDRLHLAYFAGYAVWLYVTAPFSFTYPGFQVKEVEPWQENGETWRVLNVTFPENVASHSREQRYYFGDDGLIRRIDFDTEVLGGAPATHYVSEYQNVDGIMVGTRRHIYVRGADGKPQSDPLLVSLKLTDITFS